MKTLFQRTRYLKGTLNISHACTLVCTCVHIHICMYTTYTHTCNNNITNKSPNPLKPKVKVNRVTGNSNELEFVGVPKPDIVMAHNTLKIFVVLTEEHWKALGASTTIIEGHFTGTCLVVRSKLKSQCREPEPEAGTWRVMATHPPLP